MAVKNSKQTKTNVLATPEQLLSFSFALQSDLIRALHPSLVCGQSFCSAGSHWPRSNIKSPWENRKDGPFGSFKCEQLEVLVALNASCTEMNIFSILDQVRSGRSDFIILHTKKFSSQGGLTVKYHGLLLAKQKQGRVAVWQGRFLSMLNFCSENCRGQVEGFVLVGVRIKFSEGVLDLSGWYSSPGILTCLRTQIKGPGKVRKADVLIPLQCVQKA